MVTRLRETKTKHLRRKEAKAMDSIIDRFGSDVVVSYHDETHSKVIVPVALSDAFYAWVFGLGKKIRITAPEEAVEGMKKLLADVASRYSE